MFGAIVDLVTGLLAISNDTLDLINFTVINFNILTINRHQSLSTGSKASCSEQVYCDFDLPSFTLTQDLHH